MNLYRHLVTAGAVGALALGSACADQASNSPDGPGIEIKVAPVTYNAAVDLCYGINVANAGGDTVVHLNNICSSDFGNGAGGDIAYVAPCDASNGGSSTVTIWLEGIRVAEGSVTEGTDSGTGAYDVEPEGTYINPCGLADADLDDGAGPFPEGDLNYDGFSCSRTVTCQPDADVQVAFNLTVMRSAQQGIRGASSSSWIVTWTRPAVTAPR
jgi:hypothetical protein